MKQRTKANSVGVEASIAIAESIMQRASEAGFSERQWGKATGRSRSSWKRYLSNDPSHGGVYYTPIPFDAICEAAKVLGTAPEEIVRTALGPAPEPVQSQESDEDGSYMLVCRGDLASRLMQAAKEDGVATEDLIESLLEWGLVDYRGSSAAPTAGQFRHMYRRVAELEKNLEGLKS